MKTLKKLSLVVFSLLLISSCVSTQKYTELQNENKKYKEQDSILRAKNMEVMKLNDKLALQTLAVQKNYDKKLDEKQKALDRIQKALKLERQEMNNTQEQVKKAMKSFAPNEFAVRERNDELYVSMFDKLLFTTGKADVNSRGKEALKQLAEVLKSKNIQIRVEGHTDAVPINNKKYKDNWDLSVDRATNVTRILIANGVKPERIIASGRGQYRPFVANYSDFNRKYNRRTDIVLVPKFDKLWAIIDEDNKTAYVKKDDSKSGK